MWKYYSDFIDHPQPKDSVGPPTTSGPQAPHHLNPALLGRKTAKQTCESRSDCVEAKQKQCKNKNIWNLLAA